ncbi:hypothetical protein [Pajaroellobacter abortibovis]|uniref:Uncharacterized protein n=1 Tax=Pajaroellobacter abortibovis TaxID=1882918 RepID=A0A1L6MYN3_9BACT|nr:hypothetical protein [Pajaroellobacter abortibovis]APS00579.1 hypothetical protein BCY86_07750 [Pajaroellobacter abortibovis]
MAFFRLFAGRCGGRRRQLRICRILPKPNAQIFFWMMYCERQSPAVAWDDRTIPQRGNEDLRDGHTDALLPYELPLLYFRLRRRRNESVRG